MPRMKNKVIRAWAAITGLCLIGALSACSSYNHLQVDYIESAMQQNPNYFDGYWSGSLECSAIGSYPPFTHYISVNLENGETLQVHGSKGYNGYEKMKWVIDQEGKIRIRGQYYWDKLKRISFWGQVGVDPEGDESEEVAMFGGRRGPRTCSAKLTRNRVFYETKKSEAVKTISKTSDESSIINITSHQPGSFNVTDQPETVITGNTSDDSDYASLFIQGKKVGLSSNGSFRVRCSLTLGINPVEIKLSRNKRHVASKEVSIVRIPDKKNLSAPVITVLTFPKDENYLFSHFDQVQISGIVTSRHSLSALYVNDDSIGIDSNNRFYKSLYLKEGKNVIRIEATDSKGSSSVRTFVLMYKKLPGGS